MFRSYSASIWRNYKLHIESIVQFPSDHLVQDFEYWQQKLFTTGVLYGLPLSLLALIPSVYLESRSGSLLIASFEILTTAAFAFLVLKRGLSVKLRKLLIVSMVASVSIALAIFFGEFSMFCIYLLSLSAFVALVYSNKTAYAMVTFNFFVLACFAVAIRYHVLGMHLVMNANFDHWVIYSLNFLLMNLIVVTLIRQILNGLVRTMRKEALLNHYLQASEQDYKTLFFQSPSPKLIFDIHTLQFLQVNRAATDVYGYTEKEFLEMKLTDIHPEDCMAEMLNQTLKDDTMETLLPYTTQHLGKDGRRIHAEVRRSNITYKTRKARMIISTDITERVLFTNAIQQQNKKLREIAYIQSHVIRLPLARIMSISELIAMEYSGKVDMELLSYLNISTEELDTVIRDVVNKSSEVLSENLDT